MVATPRLRRTSAACAALVGLTACSGTDAGLDAGAAALLAARADDIAAHIEAGEPCTAHDRIGALEAMVREGEADGSVPAEVADEVADVLGDLAPRTPCDDDAGPVVDDGPPADAGQDDEVDSGSESDGEGKEGKKDKGGDGRGPDGTGPPGQRDGPPGESRGRGKGGPP